LKGLPGAKTLAYYENVYITNVKSFITLGPGCGELTWSQSFKEMLEQIYSNLL
jgi:hypothetical protein